MHWEPLAAGFASSILALVQVFAWLALGSGFLRNTRDEQTLVALSLLIGSAITSCVYAVLGALGYEVARIAALRADGAI